MADLTTAGTYFQTYDNTGTGVAASKLGFNTNKIGTVNYFKSGTVELEYLLIAGTKSAAAVDISSEAFRAAVYRGVAQFADVHSIGITDSSSPYDLIVSVRKDTSNGAEAASNTQAATFGAMEAAILAAVNGVEAAKLDAVLVTPKTGFTGDVLA
jgi:hypothetical protein